MPLRYPNCDIGASDSLVEQQEQFAGEISRAEDELAEAEIQTLNASDVGEALEHFSAVFDRLESHEKREMVELVVDEVVLTGAEMKITLLGASQEGYLKNITQSTVWYPTGSPSWTLFATPSSTPSLSC